MRKAYTYLFIVCAPWALVLACILLFTGCASVGPSYEDRVQMGPGESVILRRNQLNRFTCTQTAMVCDAGGTLYMCTCPRVTL